MDYYLSQTLRPSGRPNVRCSVLRKHCGLLQRGTKILCFSPFPPCGKIALQWSALPGTRGCVRTGYVSGRQNKTRQDCVVWPEGTAADRLGTWQTASSTVSRVQELFVFLILPPPHSAVADSPCLFSAPSTFHLSSFLYLHPSDQIYMQLHSLSSPQDDSSQSVLSISTFPDVRRLLPHWDKRAFSYDYLAFKGLCVQGGVYSHLLYFFIQIINHKKCIIKKKKAYICWSGG